jgi:GT2 family glycosyltransferase
MKISLVICTYMRPKPLARLLESVEKQTIYPNEILVIDGSRDALTKEALQDKTFKNLTYYQVSEADRGLTRQRNFGVAHIGPEMEIVSFLDDDTVLNEKYFEEITACFKRHPDAIGVGGVAVNENSWKPNTSGIVRNNCYYTFDDHFVRESSRNVVRNILGLGSDKPPGVMPEFSHGKTCSYPLTGKDYPVDLIVGMSMNFRKKVFDNLRFSTYFEGYGLYEDADFSLRALQSGQNYIATAAQLNHYHDASGRPNRYAYGKMVVRNGWFVWRVKYPKPSFTAKLKWHAITLLLAFIRLTNVLTTSKRTEAFTESMGRFVGWLGLFFSKPK